MSSNKRGSSGNSSRPQKRTKAPHDFTSNTNGQETRLTRLSKKVSLEKSRQDQNTASNTEIRENSVDISTFMATLLQTAPKPEPRPDKAAVSKPPLSTGLSKKMLTSTSSKNAPDSDSTKDYENPRTGDLNEDEEDFLNDVATGQRKDDKNDMEFPENDGASESVEDDENRHLEDDYGDDATDNLRVEDVSQGSQSGRKKRKSSSQKILVSDFSNGKLAVFAKRCAREAACVVDMFPDDFTFCWPTFIQEMQLLVTEGRAQSFLDSLQEISADVEERDVFLRFMFYGVPAVRLDMGKEARIRTSQYFKIPGTFTPNEIINTVNWLLGDRRYHLGEVDIVARTCNNRPFNSPLLAMILRGYLMEGKPKQDRLLVAKLRRERSVPRELIAMVTVLVGHALQEYASGYKVENAFSATNDASHYRAVMKTLSNVAEQAPAYMKFLQTDLYDQMMTAGPEIVPAQSYDYGNLNEFALQRERLANRDGHTSEGDSSGGRGGVED